MDPGEHVTSDPNVVQRHSSTMVRQWPLRDGGVATAWARVRLDLETERLSLRSWTATDTAWHRHLVAERGGVIPTLEDDARGSRESSRQTATTASCRLSSSAGRRGTRSATAASSSGARRSTNRSLPSSCSGWRTGTACDRGCGRRGRGRSRNRARAAMVHRACMEHAIVPGAHETGLRPASLCLGPSWRDRVERAGTPLRFDECAHSRRRTMAFPAIRASSPNR